MKIHLRICIILWACMCVGISQAQTYTVKSVNLLNNDLYARKNVRNDKAGNACAVIRLNIVGIEDLQFPDAVGDIKYSLGEYIVYVSENLSTLKFYNKEKSIEEEIKFEDWGFDAIEKLRVYRIVLDSDSKYRVAIFSIYPQSAKLKFSGKEVILDDMGMATIEGRIGEYPYEVSAEGYKSNSGQLTLHEDNISTISNIILQPQEYSLSLNCNISEALLYIDNVSLGKVNQTHDYYLQEGNHVIRLVAPKYKNYEKQICINEDTQLDVKMTQLQQKVVKYRKERTRTKVNIRNAHYIRWRLETKGLDYNKDNHYGYGDKIKVEYLHCNHFLGIGELCKGIGFGLMANGLDENESGESTFNNVGLFLDVPLQIGVGFPFGRYNKHFFSALIGGYASAYGFETNEFPNTDDISYSNIETSVSDKYTDYDYDYGLRTTIRLDISNWSIGFNLSKSINNGDVIFGVAIGRKLYFW